MINRKPLCLNELDRNAPNFEISSVLFNVYKNVTFWKVELTVFTILTNGITTNGTSSLILKINQAPYNGICVLNNSTGMALETYFILNCTNWIDSDGYIVSYTFYGSI